MNDSNNQSSIRYPAVAGTFYPADATELQGCINKYLDEAKQRLISTDFTASTPPVKAIVAPHAGYIYSGPIAASAYARILPRSENIRRVILLGPSHRVPVIGLAASHARYFQSPLGNIPLDQDAIQQLIKHKQVNYLDQAHDMEHSLEVHLPFLQTILNDFSLVPLVVGETEPDEVADVLETLWGGEETLIVISSDLSHYHNYAEAHQLDQKTSSAIENLQPDKIGYGDACGRNPLNGLLQLAKKKNAHMRTVDLRNSGDTSGDKSRVVGYGAYVLNETSH